MQSGDRTIGSATNIGERAIEVAIFASRWVLAPIYVGLALSLLMLLVKFAQEFWHMASNLIEINASNVIVGILSLVDLSLIANLLLMIIFGGYQNFASRLQLNGH